MKHSNNTSGLKIFSAVYHNQIIGTIFILYHGKTLYDWYAGSLKEFYNKYPNDLLPWEVFMWGKENGFTKFDFGGAGRPGVPYGVRDYKKKFGGEFVNFGRYQYVHKPIKMKISKIGFKLFQKFIRIP